METCLRFRSIRGLPCKRWCCLGDKFVEQPYLWTEYFDSQDNVNSVIVANEQEDLAITVTFVDTALQTDAVRHGMSDVTTKLVIFL